VKKIKSKIILNEPTSKESDHLEIGGLIIM